MHLTLHGRIKITKSLLKLFNTFNVTSYLNAHGLHLLSFFAVEPSAVNGSSRNQATDESDDNIPELNHVLTPRLAFSISS